MRIQHHLSASLSVLVFSAIAFHRRFTGVDPKCQTAFGSALTDCLQNSGKGK